MQPDDSGIEEPISLSIFLTISLTLCVYQVGVVRPETEDDRARAGAQCSLELSRRQAIANVYGVPQLRRTLVLVLLVPLAIAGGTCRVVEP